MGVGIFSWFYWGQSSKESLSLKGVKTAERRDLIHEMSVAGNIAPERTVSIAAPFDGYIKKLYVRVGEKVKKGRPVVMVAQTFESQTPNYPIRAPFEGTVVSIQHGEGEFVRKEVSFGSGGDILRIDKLDHLYVKALVPEMDALKIKKDQEVQIMVMASPQKKYRGVVEEISLAPKKDGPFRTENVRYPIRARILDQDENLRSGMSVILNIVTFKKENALTLPHEYLFKEQGKHYVFLKSGEKKEVQIGLKNEFFSEILQGIKEGDQVKLIDFVGLLSEENHAHY